MKRRFGAICLVLLTIATLATPMVSSAATKTVPVSSVTVIPGSASLYVGDTRQLTVTVNPADQVSQKVTYKSSKTSVATVTQSGLVKGKAAGSAKITITSSANKKKAKTISITVKRRPKLRVLSIGNCKYRMDQLLGPWYDIRNIADLYRLSKLAGKPPAKNVVKDDRTIAQMKKDITSTFKDAKSGDVSVFYYSGHGIANYNATKFFSIAGVNFNGSKDYMLIKDLRAQLQKIPGTVVVILDCCFSGAFPAGKSARAVTSDFNRAVIQEFGGSSKGISSKFRVLTASKYNQSSHEFRMEGYAFGMFTQAIVEGIIDEDANGTPFLALYCDTNGDGIVELRELYNFTRNWTVAFLTQYREQEPISSADVQVYPNNSSFAVFDFR